MAHTLQPWQVLRAAIDFLREENRVLLEQLGDRRIRIAVAGKAVGRKALLDLARHRKLVAAKWDQRARRGPRSPTS